MERKNTAAGFTLIETLIYTAFFALLVGSLLAITFQTLSSSGQVARKIAVQQEANFILRKIDWALSGGTGLSVPSSDTLSVTKDGIVQSFSLDAGRVKLGDTTLNSANVLVSNLQFVRTQTGTQPQKITATFSAGGENFELTKFLKY